MTGPAESDIKLEGVRVYVHRKDRATRAQTTHVDVKHQDPNGIVEPGNARKTGTNGNGWV